MCSGSQAFEIIDAEKHIVDTEYIYCIDWPFLPVIKAQYRLDPGLD